MFLFLFEFCSLWFNLAKNHLKYFDEFVDEIKSEINAKLSFNDPIIALLLANKHVNYAVKYSKQIYHDLEKLKSEELVTSGLVGNLLCFLCTNKLKRLERQQYLSIL